MLPVAGDGYCVTKAFFDILELPQKNRVDCLLLCGLWIVVIGQQSINFTCLSGECMYLCER